MDSELQEVRGCVMHLLVCMCLLVRTQWSRRYMMMQTGDMCVCNFAGLWFNTQPRCVCERAYCDLVVRCCCLSVELSNVGRGSRTRCPPALAPLSKLNVCFAAYSAFCTLLMFCTFCFAACVSRQHFVLHVCVKTVLPPLITVCLQASTCLTQLTAMGREGLTENRKFFWSVNRNEHFILQQNRQDQGFWRPRLKVSCKNCINLKGSGQSIRYAHNYLEMQFLSC